MENNTWLSKLIIWLVIGAIAGWLAGQIMRGGGFGLVGDIVVGIVGAIVGGWLLPRIGVFVFGGVLGEILNAVIGACVVLFIARLFK
ncbi:MAG: GlsB/YeaQ/YmgE family stress response membrane protein [Hyphomicrobium sp.]|nr:GlsB/YeaQ/YmgE family stress response membrane protein [Hyphomicrobium sp.]